MKTSTQLAVYVVAYILLVSAFSNHKVEATCNAFQDYFAEAIDQDSGSKYGVYGVQPIDGAALCGTSGTDSTVSIHSYVYWTTGDWISTGWYKGEAGDASSWQSSLDQYYDGKTSGSYYFSDVSLGTGDYFSLSDTVDFRNQNQLSGTNAWQIYADDTTASWSVTVSGITAPSTNGPNSEADMESHNNQNSASGEIYSLQNLLYSGGSTYTWTSWSTGQRANSYPFCATKNSVTDYSYYTSSGGIC